MPGWLDRAANPWFSNLHKLCNLTLLILPVEEPESHFTDDNPDISKFVQELKSPAQATHTWCHTASQRPWGLRQSWAKVLHKSQDNNSQNSSGQAKRQFRKVGREKIKKLGVAQRPENDTKANKTRCCWIYIFFLKKETASDFIITN